MTSLGARWRVNNWYGREELRKIRMTLWRTCSRSISSKLSPLPVSGRALLPFTYHLWRKSAKVERGRLSRNKPVCISLSRHWAKIIVSQTDIRETIQSSLLRTTGLSLYFRMRIIAVITTVIVLSENFILYNVNIQQTHRKNKKHHFNIRTIRVTVYKYKT